MKLTPPFDLSTIVQGFGKNDIKEYSSLGLKGHPGIDFQVPWGTPIPSAIDMSEVCAILSRDNPNLMAFRAVNTVVDDGEFSYEIQYGHCSAIYAGTVPGKVLRCGETLANVGNTGDVFDNGVEVSAAQKHAGSHAGSHLHFQVRKLKKVPSWTPNASGVHYLNDGEQELILGGFKYEVVDFDNGYNGCVDPMPFFIEAAAETPELIKQEVQVLNAQQDPAVRAAFVKMIIAQVRAFLGW